MKFYFTIIILNLFYNYNNNLIEKKHTSGIGIAKTRICSSFILNSEIFLVIKLFEDLFN